MSATELSLYKSQYEAKKALFRFLGNAFRLYNTDGSLAFYVKQKAFKLKEDITVFADEDEKRPVLRIKARKALDFSAIYDVIEVGNDEVIGALQRQGMKSLLRDEWHILNTNGEKVGDVIEDSMALALVRRFLSNLIPQSFTMKLGAQVVGTIAQHWNPFRLGYKVDFTPGGTALDPRMGVAAVVLLLAIEGRQAGG
jgi:uncharacterized protein YxjI